MWLPCFHGKEDMYGCADLAVVIIKLVRYSTSKEDLCPKKQKYTSLLSLWTQKRNMSKKVPARFLKVGEVKLDDS